MHRIVLPRCTVLGAQHPDAQPGTRGPQVKNQTPRQLNKMVAFLLGALRRGDQSMSGSILRMEGMGEGSVVRQEWVTLGPRASASAL